MCTSKRKCWTVASLTHSLHVKVPLSLSPLNTLCCLCLAAVAAKVAEWKERMAKIASGEISKDEDLPEENLYPAEEVGICCPSVCLSVCLLAPFTLLKRWASSVCHLSVCLLPLLCWRGWHLLSVCLLPLPCWRGWHLLSACSLYSAEEVGIFCLSVPLVELRYLVFTRLPGVSYHVQLRALRLCLCDLKH